MNDQHYDVGIIGAGSNGLTAAAYLARAGARVIVLEARFERGGTLASDDYSTPFLYNQAQFLLPLGRDLPPFHDLELEQHAVAFIEPELAFATTLDGDTLLVERGGRGLGNQLQAMFAKASRTVAPLLYQSPGEASQRSPDGPYPARLALASMTPNDVARAAGDERAALILRYACALAGFQAGDEPLGAIGAFALARLFEPILVAGGSKCLANGLFRAAARAGARCLVSKRVVSLEPGDNGIGLRLADRTHLRVSAVISTLDPITTFVELLGPERAGDALSVVAAEWVLDASGPFTAHFGIKGGPPTSATGDGEDDAVVRVLGFQSADEVGGHLDALANGHLPARPAGHMTASSRHDPLQASSGPYGPLHTLRYETPAPYEHPNEPWDRARVEYRKRCWELVRSEVGGLDQARLLFQFADSPADLERRFTTARHGSVRQGSLRPEQTFSGRPHPSCADGRTPIPGLYLGGGSVHPGVPGSLGGGYNVAAIVCADLGLDRWWQPRGVGSDDERPLIPANANPDTAAPG